MSAVERLESLAIELVRRGYVVRRWHRGDPPWIVVCLPAVPACGESVTACPISDLEQVSPLEPLWWFRTSSWALLAPCDRPADAATRFEEIMAPIHRVAARKARPAVDQRQEP
ncbi:hypothetical protein SMC26_29600 [Actinomadura fulvescens]|uniref:Uncharacterized protein n=1 Tax=Actinomadura fulvescens TaxID=46160 RepID=A0ABP6CXD0_9ACTN